MEVVGRGGMASWVVGKVVVSRGRVRVSWEHGRKRPKRLRGRVRTAGAGSSVSHSQSLLSTAITLVATQRGARIGRRMKRRLNVRSSGLGLLGLGLGFWFKWL